MAVIVDHGPALKVGATDERAFPYSDRSLRRLCLALVGIGMALRLGFFLLDFPLWWDEAFLATNFLRRGFVGLLRPLDYGQVCPILFLWAELAIVRLFGFSEWTVRLFPLLCALVSVPLFYFCASRILSDRALLLSLAIFAVSIHPIRHAADLKPYSADLLVALSLQALAITWLRNPTRLYWVWILVGLAPFCLLLSHPAVFVVAGVGLAMVGEALIVQKKSVWLSLIAYGVIASLVYASFYVLYVRNQASIASPGMKEMWVNSFAPMGSPFLFLRWLVVAHTGDMLAYPCGGENSASSLSLLAAMIGSFVFWRSGRRLALACLLTPLGLAIIASALKLYPYGGPAPHGSAARIMQYAAPGLCLLIGSGFSEMVAWISIARVRERLFRVALCGLLVIGLSPIVAGIIRPYRAYQAHAAREFARRFWPEIENGCEVTCLRWDLDVEEWDSIQLGVAVSLCNQAIYSPSRRRGGPRWQKVSRDHPLRCILGIAPLQDSPRLANWLAVMDQRYERIDRRTILVTVSEAGRAISRERYEIFDFVPKGPLNKHPTPEAQTPKGS